MDNLICVGSIHMDSTVELMVYPILDIEDNQQELPTSLTLLKAILLIDGFQYWTINHEYYSRSNIQVD